MTTPYEAAAREAAGKPVRFTFCGERFVTHVEVDGMVVLELSKQGADDEENGVDLEELQKLAQAGDESAAMELAAITTKQLALFYRFLESALPAREFGRFKRACRKHRVPVEDIIVQARDVMKAMFGRPPEPSSSLDGSPGETGRSSTTGELVGATTSSLASAEPVVCFS